MKLRSAILAAILCIALLLTMAGCQKSVSTEEALSRYQTACTDVRNASDMTIEISYVCNRTVGGEIFTEKMTETVAYSGLNTENVMASAVQQVAFGPYETQYSELYHKDTAYCKTEDSVFRTKMEIAEFQDRQIPAILIDAALYGTVEVRQDEDELILTFTQPTKLESWATDHEAAVLVSAAGTVVLYEDGTLRRSTYEAQYTCGSTTYDLQVKAKVKLEAAQTLEADIAALPAKCTALTYFDAPRKILQIVGDVYTAQTLSAKYTESVYSAAFARSRKQISAFDIWGTGTEFKAQTSYEVTNTDYTNTPVTNTETAVFIDGVCTSTVNGTTEIVREGITAETMRTFCEDAVLAALITPNHLKNAKLTEKDNQLRIDFTGNSAFADDLCSSIYSIFNANLDTYAESYTTPAAGGYLCIDKDSGLPTALGIALKRVHVTGEISYPLTYKLDQTMQLPSQAALQNITGEE